MNKKAWGIFITVCVLLLGGLVYLSSKDKIDVSGVDTNSINNGENIAISDHIMGNSDAKVTIIEYMDYQCPGCQSAQDSIEEVYKTNKDDVKLVVRHFPLTSIHPNAKAAAAAAESAGLQDKFWEMHHLLFDKQDEWKSLGLKDRTAKFQEYAQELELDVDKFTEDLSNEDVTKKIDYDQALGKSAGVTGTPSFYANGEAVDKYSLDGEVVDENTEGAGLIWSDTEAFKKTYITPNL